MDGAFHAEELILVVIGADRIEGLLGVSQISACRRAGGFLDAVHVKRRRLAVIGADEMVPFAFLKGGRGGYGVEFRSGGQGKQKVSFVVTEEPALFIRTIVLVVSQDGTPAYSEV